MSGSTKAPRSAPEILAPADIELVHPTTPAHQRKLAGLVDRLAGEVILRHVPGRRVLDLGHGAPQVAQWVRERASSIVVVDARDLGRGAEVRLPFRTRSFDVVYGLRTLPHLGHDEASSEQAARSAMAEVARVLAPGGTALVLIDNPRSLWGLYHGIRHVSTAVERGPLVIESDRGLTRFDTLTRFLKLLPPELTMVRVHGLRVLLASPRLLSIPLVGSLLARLEWWARDKAGLRGFGAHLLLELRRVAPQLRA